MHKRFVEELLEEEVALARSDESLMPRITYIERRGRAVYVRATNTQGPFLLRLYGPNYNADPLRVTALDPETEAELAGSDWPGQLYFGGDHPSLSGPWTCVVATYEYHCHSSHIEDTWDSRRPSYNLPTTLRQLLTKAGA